jgi:hypothetical protein
MREHDLSHAREVIVKKRRKKLGIERLDQPSEACDVREQRRDLATLSAKVDRLAVRRQPFGEVGRKVPR